MEWERIENSAALCFSVTVENDLFFFKWCNSRTHRGQTNQNPLYIHILLFFWHGICLRPFFFFSMSSSSTLLYISTEYFLMCTVCANSVLCTCVCVFFFILVLFLTRHVQHRRTVGNPPVFPPSIKGFYLTEDMHCSQRALRFLFLSRRFVSIRFATVSFFRLVVNAGYV